MVTDRLLKLPEIVNDFYIETESVSDTVVHVFRGIHGRRRQIWSWGEELGRGGAGVVQLQTCIEGYTEADPKMRAVRCLPLKDASKFIHYSRELETLAKFSQKKYSDFFVNCHGWFKTPKWLYVSLEYLLAGDLENYLSARHKLPPEEARMVASQIANGLHYMHGPGFAHRDLKPKNILVAACPPFSWWVKLGDFGLSKRITTDYEITEPMGTENYVAPEILFLSDSKAMLDEGSMTNWFAADMWSLGQVVSRCLFGALALQGRATLLRYFQGKIDLSLEQPSELKISTEAIRFIHAAILEARTSYDGLSFETGSVRPWNTYDLHSPSSEQAPMQVAAGNNIESAPFSSPIHKDLLFIETGNTAAFVASHLTPTPTTGSSDGPDDYNSRILGNIELSRVGVSATSNTVIPLDSQDTVHQGMDETDFPESSRTTSPMLADWDATTSAVSDTNYQKALPTVEFEYFGQTDALNQLETVQIRRMSAGCIGKDVYLFDVVNGLKVRHIIKHNTEVAKIDFNPDCRRLASVTASGVVRFQH
ncbi:hypothetical protein NLG97_g3968 [Lecanicillium saksenae]|uniref:Uncharacterized protein n=1 Tax=Lecanicillium saksenae TaxID=468837 RepID=A0ACC1QX74_9HYPO|nr:hypothetical protein NLG97_g3968 [Lecanicillium saksenae]